MFLPSMMLVCETGFGGVFTLRWRHNSRAIKTEYATHKYPSDSPVKLPTGEDATILTPQKRLSVLAIHLCDLLNNKVSMDSTLVCRALSQYDKPPLRVRVKAAFIPSIEVRDGKVKNKAYAPV